MLSLFHDIIITNPLRQDDIRLGDAHLPQYIPIPDATETPIFRDVTVSIFNNAKQKCMREMVQNGFPCIGSHLSHIYRFVEWFRKLFSHISPYTEMHI